MTDSQERVRRGADEEEQEDAPRVSTSQGQQNMDRLNSANATSSQLNAEVNSSSSGRRSHVWAHPSSGYLNAESYFPPTHPFSQRRPSNVHRNRGMPFGYQPFVGAIGAPSYVNPFPRRGIGTTPSQMYPSHMDPPVYLYRQQQHQPTLHRGIRQGPQVFATGGRDVYSYGPRAFMPSGETSLPNSSGLGLNFEAASEVIDQVAVSSPPQPKQQPILPVEEVRQANGSTSNEGSSETESIEPPSENPVGTSPIFHPLPSMFNPCPRPLAFPISNRNKELPTLALFQNCSLESKVVGDYSDSHQELSLMLALPGLSTHQAPLLSLQQAGDILQTINNPLVVLKVGRLARKLVPDPALLKPTDDVGTLALWLSPTSDVRLFWHSFLKGPTSDTARDVEEQSIQLRSQGEGSPYKELFSHVELSEELAWVAAESDQVDGGSGIRLEMMKHDPSGRSFKLTRKKAHDRQKTELASKLATKERTTGVHVTEENRKLHDLLEQCMSEDPEEEDSYFFWIAESSVSEGMQMLNTMQRRLDHLPTLASESGVPEKKLQELYDWFSKAQKAASSDSTLSNEIASWIDLRSGASVPSQLFSNTCPANVPNWSESQPSSSEIVESLESPAENTIREGCALSATANFLVADKKWGLTHLATASVMVVVGVESTGFFYDEAKAHLDLSHCAHELAKKRAEAGASAEAERLGRIRLEELVAVKSLKEMRSNKTEAEASTSQSKMESQNVSPQSEELIQKQQAMLQSMQDRSGQRRLPMQTYPSRSSPYVVPGQSIQGNSVMHHSHVYANPDVVTHMPDSFRQHVHYGFPADHAAPVHQPWKHDDTEAGGNIQVVAPNQQYDHPSWSVPLGYHSYPWPYGDSALLPPHQIPVPAVYQRPFVLSPPPPALPSFRPRHLPPQLPYLQVAQMHNGGRRHKQPNMSLVRIAKEAIEKVARNPRDRVRAGPSGSNLAAANINIDQNHDDVAYAWHDPAHQLGALYRNTSLNMARLPDGDPASEARTHAETPKNTTAEDADYMQ